jgi:poly(3-hydroxybutyrate) depolymerase
MRDGFDQLVPKSPGRAHGVLVSMRVVARELTLERMGGATMHTKFLLLSVSLLSSCSSSDGGTTPSGNGGDSAGTGGVASASSGGSNVVGAGGVSVGAGGGVSGSSGGTGTAFGGGRAVGNGGTVAGGGTGGTAGPGGTGGVSATGGTSQGGQGGAASPDQPSPSAGCGMAAPMTGALKIDVAGTSRDYILALPTGYDPKTSYRLVFAWHGLGGSAAQVASNWYGLKSQSANGAIFVAGQGLQTTTSVGNGAGWPNTNGQDVAFVKALYAQLKGQLCFDQNRVFSVGMSYGGIMSDTLGCQMGDVFRAIAPMSGSGPRGTCVGQVAVWMSNGDNDAVVPTAQERASRDFWVSANHCQTASVPVDPSPCVAYQGCDSGNPVTWCEFAGGHTIPPFAGSAIWKFFSQF